MDKYPTAKEVIPILADVRENIVSRSRIRWKDQFEYIAYVSIRIRVDDDEIKL